VRCFECGDMSTTNHHVVPSSLGGTKTVRLCDKCHSLIHRDKEVKTSELTKAALAKKIRNGEKTGGHIPFGYDLRADKKILVKNKGEQKVIKTMSELRLSGLTWRNIAKCLNTRGISTKFGKKWQANSVRRILKREERIR